MLTTDTTPTPATVKLVDVDLPIGTLVTLMVKWTIAAIPAGIILGGVALFVIMLARLFVIGA